MATLKIRSASPITLTEVLPPPPPPVSTPVSYVDALTPGGRLTLLAGVPEMPQNADYSSATLYCSPFHGDTVPLMYDGVWNAQRITTGPLDAVGLSISGGADWIGGQPLDVFVTRVAGLPVQCTRPWPGESFSARGLVPYNGRLVNATAMQVTLSEGNSVTVPAYEGLWRGSLCPATTGTLTAKFTPGQDRRCDVWNVYHQREISLLAGCPPVNGARVDWTPPTFYPGPDPLPGSSVLREWRPFNGDIKNGGYYFTGQPQNVECLYRQNGFLKSENGANALITTVCKDTIQNSQGSRGSISADLTNMASAVPSHALFNDRSSVGLHRAIMCAAGANNVANVTASGFDPRPTFGTLDFTHGLYIKYLG